MINGNVYSPQPAISAAQFCTPPRHCCWEAASVRRVQLCASSGWGATTASVQCTKLYYRANHCFCQGSGAFCSEESRSINRNAESADGMFERARTPHDEHDTIARVSGNDCSSSADSVVIDHRRVIGSMWPLVHHSILRKVRLQDVDDVAQEVMLRACQKFAAHTSLTEDAIGAYISGIVRYVCLEYYGRKRAVGCWPREAPPRMPEEVNDLDLWLSTRALDRDDHAVLRTPEGLASYMEEVALLRAAYAMLGAEEQEAIREWSVHEQMKAICAARGLPSPPSEAPKERTRSCRAREKLRLLVRELEQRA